jgi:hypothetical protein
MDIRRVLQTYAKVMLMLSIIGASLLYYQGDVLGKQVLSLESQLAQVKTDATAKEREYRALESDQQANRAQYDPQQTVMMSYKVQEAKQAYDSAKTALDSLEPELETQRDKREHLLLWLVPVIAVFLIHLIMAIMFRPLRDELADRAAGSTGKPQHHHRAGSNK